MNHVPVGSDRPVKMSCLDKGEAAVPRVAGLFVAALTKRVGPIDDLSTAGMFRLASSIASAISIRALSPPMVRRSLLDSMLASPGVVHDSIKSPRYQLIRMRSSTLVIYLVSRAASATATAAAVDVAVAAGWATSSISTPCQGDTMILRYVRWMELGLF